MTNMAKTIEKEKMKSRARGQSLPLCVCVIPVCSLSRLEKAEEKLTCCLSFFYLRQKGRNGGKNVIIPYKSSNPSCKKTLKLNEDVTRKGGVVGEILVIDAYDQLEIIGDFEPLNTSEHLKRQCEEGVRFQVHIFPLACKERKKKRKERIFVRRCPLEKHLSCQEQQRCTFLYFLLTCKSVTNKGKK